MAPKKIVFEQKDHIILPKATLKRFANPDTNKITCLDLSNPDDISIIQKFPSSFHTKPNYYIPKYDDRVKIYETRIGEYFKLIKDYNTNNSNIKIDVQQLKTDILDIINIQFQRSVIADDAFLNKLLEHFKEQYRQESLFFIRQGIYPKEFQERKQNFDKASKNIETFRYYAQAILGQKNEKILEAYRNFVPHILIIPDNINSTFILSPQHFVSIGGAVRIILSPRITLSLYPAALTPNNELVKYLTKKEVDLLVSRTIESALSMTTSYRQVIGEENYLNCMKSKLQLYKSIVYNLVDDIILIKEGTLVLNNDQAFLELAVSIKLFKPDCHKIIIELSAISNEFLQDYEFIDSVQMYERWELALVFINNSDFKNPNIKIKIARNKEEAINMF